MAIPPSSRDPFVPGSLINGKYRLLDQIGAGGMGKVYKASQLPLERPVAVKVVHPHLGGQGSSSGGSKTEGEAFQRRFFREASALSQLRHRNIVTVFDYGRVDGHEAFFMVMEFLDGAPLSAQLRGGQRMTPPAVLDMLRQVGRGLREVHKQGMVHRDLKPANIFLAQEGEETLYKLLDFGLVKQVKNAGDPDELTEAGALLGSPTYMAPEQVEGGTIDARADLYSLGALAFHCLTGKPPFEGSLTQVMLQHVHKEAPSLAERCPGESFPPELERLIARCLAKKPEDRYQLLDAMLEDLRVCEARYGVGGMGFTGSYPGVPPPSSSGSFPGTGPASSPFRDRPSGKAPEEHGSLASLALTEGPTRVDVPPVPASKKGPGLLFGLALGGALLGAGALALRPSTSAVEAPTSVASSAVAASSGQEPRKAILSLGSIPAGAQVMEGERVLGVTPLEVPLEQGAKRSLWLKMEGFEPFSLESLPTESTRMVIPLKAASEARAAPGKGAPRGGPAPGGKAAAKATATQEQPPPPPAIRMTR